MPNRIAVCRAVFRGALAWAGVLLGLGAAHAAPIEFTASGTIQFSTVPQVASGPATWSMRLVIDPAAMVDASPSPQLGLYGGASELAITAGLLNLVTDDFPLANRGAILGNDLVAGSGLLDLLQLGGTTALGRQFVVAASSPVVPGFSELLETDALPLTAEAFAFVLAGRNLSFQIFESGRFAGAGTVGEYAFRNVPVPEPGTGTLLACALLAMLASRRRALQR